MIGFIWASNQRRELRLGSCQYWQVCYFCTWWKQLIWLGNCAHVVRCRALRSRHFTRRGRALFSPPSTSASDRERRASGWFSGLCGFLTLVLSSSIIRTAACWWQCALRRIRIYENGPKTVPTSPAFILSQKATAFIPCPNGVVYAWCRDKSILFPAGAYFIPVSFFVCRSPGATFDTGGLLRFHFTVSFSETCLKSRLIKPSHEISLRFSFLYTQIHAHSYIYIQAQIVGGASFCLVRLFRVRSDSTINVKGLWFDLWSAKPLISVASMFFFSVNIFYALPIFFFLSMLIFFSLGSSSDQFPIWKWWFYHFRGELFWFVVFFFYLTNFWGFFLFLFEFNIQNYFNSLFEFWEFQNSGNFLNSHKFFSFFCRILS